MTDSDLKNLQSEIAPTIGDSAASTDGSINSVSEKTDSYCETLESEIAPTVRGHYKNFTEVQKLAVKEFAKMHGIRAAAKHFCVPKSTVGTWKKTDFNDDTVRNRKNGHLPKSGRPLTYDEGLDCIILAHVLEQRDRQIPVTIKDICAYASNVVKPVSPGFRASHGWASAFMKRHDLCLPKKTSPTVRGHYKNFTQVQKLAVKEFAKMHGIRAAAKHFRVPRSTVGTWNKTEMIL